MHLNSSLHSPKYDFSITGSPQSPSTSSEQTTSHRSYIYKPMAISNTTLCTRNNHKKNNISALPNEMLIKIFNQSGESKLKLRSTCNRFRQCVDSTLSKEDAFKIKNSDFFYKNGLNKNQVNEICKKNIDSREFILKNAQQLHKAGFNINDTIGLSVKSEKTRDFVLKNADDLRMGFVRSRDAIYYAEHHRPPYTNMLMYARFNYRTRLQEKEFTRLSLPARRSNYTSCSIS